MSWVRYKLAFGSRHSPYKLNLLYFGARLGSLVGSSTHSFFIANQLGDCWNHLGRFSLAIPPFGTVTPSSSARTCQRIRVAASVPSSQRNAFATVLISKRILRSPRRCTLDFSISRRAASASANSLRRTRKLPVQARVKPVGGHRLTLA